MEDVFDTLVENWATYPPMLRISMAVVLGLLAICAVVSIVVSIYLAISYHKYNKKENSVGMTGEAIARNVLDANGLEHIAVKCSGSVMFGNSYSHYFKKVRLRRLTWKKASVSSMAMAVQKSCLAILDKEQDPDMVKRIRLTPIIYVGPLACIPLIIIGALLDVLVFNAAGTITMVATVVGLALYALAFIMSMLELKTEVKAQNRAYQIARECGIASEEEIGDMQKLFRLYNIEYINNMIVAMLELVLRILVLISDSKSSSDK